MSAADHLHPAQFEQLDMFRPAQDLVDHTKMKHLDSSHYYDHDDMWEAKISEAEQHGLIDSIARHGVLKPVAVAHNEEHAPRQVLADGHHRVIAAHELDPDHLVPVEHYENHREYWYKHGRVQGDIASTGEFAGGSAWSTGGSSGSSGTSETLKQARKFWANR